MIYTAEISGLGLVIALIWYLASTFLNNTKKSKKIDASNKTESIFDFNKIRELIENSNNETQLEIEDNNFQQNDYNEDLSSKVKNDLNDQNNLIDLNIESNEKHQSLYSVKKSEYSYKKNNKTSSKIYNILKNKNEFQKAIILKEILDKPKALQR